ncbi:MAG: hypothetical protein IH899_01765, partial [Planctomycetes bacterium]|nr:hypothetical protein [Planctomycetota bacterium]
VHLKKLSWYGAVPAFFTSLVSSAYIAYQYNAFRQSALFSDAANFGLVDDLRNVWGVVTTYPKLTVFIVALGLIVLACYVLLPPVFRAAHRIPANPNVHSRTQNYAHARLC